MARRSSITLCLIRCGETTWDAVARVHGSTDLPLSDAGRAAVSAQVHRIGASKASIIHHPVDEAATDTATMCALPINARTREVAELADPNLGLLEGLTEEEFAERFRSRHRQWKDEPMTLSPPEGEEMAAAAQRLFQAVAKIVRRSRGDEVAIVLHDLGWAMLRCWLADRPLSALREIEEQSRDEPPIERHALPLEMLDELERAATGGVAAS